MVERKGRTCGGDHKTEEDREGARLGNTRLWRERDSQMLHQLRGGALDGAQYTMGAAGGSMAV